MVPPTDGSPSLHASPPAGPVDTAEEALAAVVAEHPEFADHLLLPLPGGDPMIGMSSWAVVAGTEDGFQVTFVTGSGDCPAGCMEHRLDVYLVAPDGTVSHRCSRDAAPSDVTPDGGVPGDPCADVES
jgi:hypothetical protein